MQSVGRAVSEAQNRVRDDSVDPQLMKELGMNKAQFRAFVDKYTDQFGQLRSRGDKTDLPAGQQDGSFQLSGSADLQSGGRNGTEAGNASGGEKLSADNVRKLNETAIGKVAPQYRKQVEAYFRTISDSSARSAATAPAGK